MNYAESLRWLYGRQRYGIKLGLEPIQALLAELDHPESAFRAFHVAGTTGKGSTCALLDAALRAQGQRVGLYTSPHLVSFRERIQVDGGPLSEDDAAHAAERVRAAVERVEARRLTPTFFECATAMAFDHFRHAGVPVAVVEVGLGGRLDATNVCRPVASVVTPIGLDHTDRLGTSIQAIAAEKAGILRPGVPAVTSARREALDVVARHATKQGVTLRVVRRPDPIQETLEGCTFRATLAGEPHEVRTSLLGEHQAENAALAMAALDAAAPSLPLEPAKALEGIAAAQWPGRLEIVDREPLTILDGAHNAPAMDEIGGFLDRHFGDRNVAACVGILRDKAATRMLESLAHRVARLVLTEPPTGRTLTVRELEHALPRDAPPHEAAADPHEALRRLFTGGQEPVKLITGSLFLVGQARAQLLRLETDPTVDVAPLQ